VTVKTFIYLFFNHHFHKIVSYLTLIKKINVFWMQICILEWFLKEIPK